MHKLCPLLYIVYSYVYNKKTDYVSQFEAKYNIASYIVTSQNIDAYNLRFNGGD